MEIVVNMRFLWLALTFWSTVAFVLTIIRYPRGTFVQKVTLGVVLIGLGPFIPVLSVLLMPKIAEDLWLSYFKHSKRSMRFL